MKTRSRIILGLVAALLLVIAITIFSLFAIGARDEAIYVCANFKPGVTEQSVLRQLDTLELSTVSSTEANEGTIIRYSSWLTARTYECVIHIGEDSLVTEAYLK